MLSALQQLEVLVTNMLINLGVTQGQNLVM